LKSLQKITNKQTRSTEGSLFGSVLQTKKSRMFHGDVTAFFTFLSQRTCWARPTNIAQLFEKVRDCEA